MKHASLIPLIGGEVLGSEQVLGRPEYLMSYTPFQEHDSHLLNWYGDSMPYHVLDKGDKPKVHVDIISSTCPCAGLSQLGTSPGDHNEANKWMIESSKYVLGELKPEVYWGENAPGLAGKIGTNVRAQLYKIGRDNGYSMSIYRTKSILHGLSQVRERSFYFFWKGDRVPVFDYYDRPHEKIENTILNARGNSQREPINKKTPTIDDPYYVFILKELHPGFTHKDFCTKVTPLKVGRNDLQSYIEMAGVSYVDLSKWFESNGYPREVAKCLNRHEKLSKGMNIMRRSTVIPRGHIGAFVGHYPTQLTHPVEDRYINYREAMSIMGLPDSFELLNPKKNYNHICQNVPVQTAADMAAEIKEVLLGNREYVDTTMLYQYNHSKSYTKGDNGVVSTLEGFL